MTVPPFKGGQGRGADEISETAKVLASLIIVGLILILILIVVR